MIDPKELVEKVRDIKPLSEATRKLLVLMGQPNHQIRDLVRIVENEPALTANVLRVANSATFALNRKLATLAEAASYLGYMHIVGIALATSGQEVYNAELKGYDGSRGDLGRHCLWTALAAKELAGLADDVNRGIAFTSALLHDIGKVVISDFLPDYAAEMAQRLKTADVSDYLAAEREVLGTDHCAVGCLLAEHWQLPESLQMGIAHHHSPREADAEWQTTVYVVHMADMMAMMSGHGTGTDAILYALDSHYADHVNITPDRLDAMMLDLQVEFQRTAPLLFD
jgi:putative nucleotidyltransferase with HDIG domain